MTTGPALRIVRVGFATTVQDHGRAGLAHLGVPVAGAVERHTHDLVNRLVGNPPSAATIETMGALVVEALRPVVLASSTDSSRRILATGERLRVDAPSGSVWAYLAARGGIDVRPVLGSRSHDTLGGVGPPPIVEGAVLTLGADPGTGLAADHAPPRSATTDRLRIWDGPQHDWFVGGAQCLVQRSWQVTSELNRIGMRLEAGDFPRSPQWHAQMPSMGLVDGAIQITPAGEPIVMLANRPATGGYPVIAVVEPDDLPLLTQMRPGSSVRFRRA
jgi:biotin-dependent carboxylase-like uncharacterized protein